MFPKFKFFNSIAAVWLLGSLLLTACAPQDTTASPLDSGQLSDQLSASAGGDDVTPEATESETTPVSVATSISEATHTPEASTPSATPAGTLTPTLAAEIEFIGPLTAVNGNVWTIGSFNVIVTAQTEIKDDAQIGDRVKVHAQPQSDGSLVAREIELADAEDEATPIPGAGDEFEFSGPLSAINGNVWVINGLNVVVTAETEIKDNPQIGDVLKVHATLQSDNSLVAREIEKSSGAGDDQSGQGSDDDNSGSNDDHHGGNDDNSGHDGGDDHGGGGGGDDHGGDH